MMRAELLTFVVISLIRWSSEANGKTESVGCHCFRRSKIQAPDKSENEKDSWSKGKISEERCKTDSEKTNFSKEPSYTFEICKEDDCQVENKG